MHAIKGPKTVLRLRLTSRFPQPLPRILTEAMLANTAIHEPSNPNRSALEKALAELEGGTAAFAFGSGMAAIASLLQTLAPGDHVIIPHDVYHGARDLVTDQFSQWGLTHSAVDMADVDKVAAAMQAATRLVWVETPSNPALTITDIAAVAETAHAGNALCAVDNTWTTPVIQKPLEHGADIVMYSTTKYFGGHSDVLGGALILAEAQPAPLGDKLRQIQMLHGAVPSPFDCWLLLRSIPTMPLRVRQQSKNALHIAKFLQGHLRVKDVYYPGLKEAPAFPIARKQMRGGYGGMLSFRPHGGPAAAEWVANETKIITNATSLGGTESLIELRKTGDNYAQGTPPDLLRLSVGIEDVQDLVEDLDQALSLATMMS